MEQNQTQNVNVNENANVNVNENANANANEQVTPGWRGVSISPNLPLHAIIEFLNILNERLVTLEDIITVTDSEGKTTSITEVYRQMEVKNTTEQPEKGE